MSTHPSLKLNTEVFLIESLPTSPSENYGFVLRDCAAALSVNPKCIKAYYRSSLALLALERAKQALDCCDRCLALDPENPGINGVRERAWNLKERQDQKAAAEEERKKQEAQRRRVLYAALKVRLAFDVCIRTEIGVALVLTNPCS